MGLSTAQSAAIHRHQTRLYHAGFESWMRSASDEGGTPEEAQRFLQKTAVIGGRVERLREREQLDL